MKKSLAVLLLAATALAMSLTGCGTNHAAAVSSGVQRPPAPVVVSEHNNGKTVHVPVGTKITLLLHSSYWTIAPSPKQSVLSGTGKPTWLKAGNCPPGVGCRPQETTFTADSPGTVTLTASRTACGEALACTGSMGHYQVTVVITR
jgi:hypothetical protein